LFINNPKLGQIFRTPIFCETDKKDYEKEIKHKVFG